MKNIFDPNLLNELLDLAHNPPGGDVVLGAFYTALVELIEKNHKIAKILMDVKRKRPEITYKHLSYLIFRAYQAVKFKEQNLSYRNLTNVSKWQQELSIICSNSYFKSLLNTRSVTTTIYQRYAGPYAIISNLWDGQEFTIADLGCGGNYGLRGIELHEPFGSIEDLTPDKLFTKLLLKPIHLKLGLAIDKEDPDVASIKAWRLACSFYPQELNNLAAVEKFETRIKMSKMVKFIKADLLKFRNLPKESVDVIILSTTLYQLNLQDQLIVLEQAKKLLRPNGFIIVQDFAIKSLANPNHLDFNESWFGKSFSYRTFITGKKTAWKFLELFQWDNGRCQIVKAGEDFKSLKHPELLLHTPHPD